VVVEQHWKLDMRQQQWPHKSGRIACIACTACIVCIVPGREKEVAVWLGKESLASTQMLARVGEFQWVVVAEAEVVQRFNLISKKAFNKFILYIE